MPVKFFGHYLVEQGLLQPHLLKDIHDHTYYLHRMIGELAIKRGWLEHDDLERVLHQQVRSDRFAGELCIEDGLLTESQVDELLEHQRQHHVRVGEVLLELGHIEEETLARALAAFHQDQAPYARGANGVPDVLRVGAAERVLDVFPRLALRTGGLHVRLGDVRPFTQAQSRELSVAARLAGGPGLEIGVSCDARFGRGLLRVACGSVEPPVPDAEVQRVLQQFVERLGSFADPNARPVATPELRREAFACQFISTRGDGELVLFRSDA
jgi:hypothetical protein